MKSLIATVCALFCSMALASPETVPQLIQRGEAYVRQADSPRLSEQARERLEAGINDVYFKLSRALRNPPPGELNPIVAELGRLEAAMAKINPDDPDYSGK